MAGKVGGLVAKRPESFIVTLQLQGQEFAFRLFTRPLRLGQYGTVQYYWFDSSQFRNLKSVASCAAFRDVVGFWAAAMREIGLQDDQDQQRHYVMAICYALVSRCKGLQSIYRDAYLAPRMIDVESLSLPDDIRQRIGDVVRSRDRFQVQQELDQTLGRFEPPARLMPLLQEAFSRWVGKGVLLMRREGNDGLEKFLAEADYWLSKYRKRSDRWVRHFIDLFAYESKVAFYTCYANAWTALVPWLRDNRGLDPLSERFLGFWHNQNQPIEIPHGQTLGGILYPTLHSVTVLERGSEATLVPRTLVRRSEQIGLTHVRDVFSGQVLSLHPLSGFFMKDPALCAIAGRFFGTEAYDMVFRQGKAQFCGEYWDLIGAILGAASLYRQASDRQAQQRGVRSRAGGDQAVSNDRPDDRDEAILEDFAAARGHRCPACQGALRLCGYEPAGPDDAACVATFACSNCNREKAVTIDRDDLTRWLPSGN